MKRLTTILLAGALALGACSAATETDEPTPTEAPTTTVAAAQDTTTTTEVAETIETTTTTTEAPEETTWEDITDAEIAEAMAAVCSLTAIGWQFSDGEPDPAATALEWQELLYTGDEATDRLNMANTAGVMRDVRCPSEYDGLPIPAGVEEFLQEVAVEMIELLS